MSNQTFPVQKKISIGIGKHLLLFSFVILSIILSGCLEIDLKGGIEAAYFDVPMPVDGLSPYDSSLGYDYENDWSMYGGYDSDICNRMLPPGYSKRDKGSDPHCNNVGALRSKYDVSKLSLDIDGGAVSASTKDVECLKKSWARDIGDVIRDWSFIPRRPEICDQNGLPLSSETNSFHGSSYCEPAMRSMGFICVPDISFSTKKRDCFWNECHYVVVSANDWVPVPLNAELTATADDKSDSVQIKPHSSVSFSCSGFKGPRVSFEDGHRQQCSDTTLEEECDLSGIDDDCDGNIDERVIPYEYAVFTNNGTCQTGEKYVGAANASHAFGSGAQFGGNCNPYDVNNEAYLYEGAGSTPHFDLSSIARNDYDYNKNGAENKEDETFAFAKRQSCLPSSQNRVKTPPIYPQRERYDGIDNDCDGSVDEASDVDSDSYCDENMYLNLTPNNKIICSNANEGDLSYYDLPSECTDLSSCGNVLFEAFCERKGLSFYQHTVDNRVTSYRMVYGADALVCQNESAGTYSVIDAPTISDSFVQHYCPSSYPRVAGISSTSVTCEGTFTREVNNDTESYTDTTSVSLVSIMNLYCKQTTPGNNTLLYQTKWATDYLPSYYFRHFATDNIICEDTDGTKYTIPYLCPDSGCVQETYVNTYLENLACNETQKFVGQTQTSSYTSFIDTSTLTCPSTTEQGTDPADDIGAIDGTLNFDSCDGLDNDQDGLVDEGNGDADFADCTYSTNLLYHKQDGNGKFYACTDDPVKFTEISEYVTTDTSLGTNALERRDTPNVKAYNDTCDIVGSYYCAADDHWKSTYRFNSVLAAGYGGDIVSRVRTTPDGTQNYCCPPDWCAWNATLNCVENLTYSYANAGWFDPDTVSQVRCSKGEWKPSIKKYDWYHDQFGYCHDPYTQCYADEDTFTSDPRLGSYADNLGTTQCFDSGEFYENHYCEEGNWSTRTKQIAMKLMHFADENMLTSYALSCGNSSLVLNENPSSYTWMTTCMEGSCANEFCVLRYDEDDEERVVLGTSLNILPNETLPTSGTSFLEELGVSQYYCDNVLAKDRENLLNNKYFVCSGDKSLFYNPVTQSMLFTNDPIQDMGEYTSAWNQMVAMVSHPLHSLSVLFESIASMFSSTEDVLSEARENDLAVLGNVSDFTQLYLSRSGSQNVYGLMEMKAGTDGSIYSSYAVSYEGFSFDLCSYVETYNENIDPSHTVRDIDCFNQTDEKQTLYYRSNSFMLWSDLTQKMRLDE